MYSSHAKEFYMRVTSYMLIKYGLNQTDTQREKWENPLTLRSSSLGTVRVVTLCPWGQKSPRNPSHTADAGSAVFCVDAGSSCHRGKE